MRVYPATASPLVFLRVYTALTISLVDLSGVVAQVLENMRKRPDLLSESLNFLPASIPHLSPSV